MPNLNRKGKLLPKLNSWSTSFLFIDIPFLKKRYSGPEFKKKNTGLRYNRHAEKISLGHSFTSLDRQKTNHPCLQLYQPVGVISSFFAALARLQAAGLFVEVPYFKVRKDCELSSRNNPKLKLNTSLIFFVCQFQRLEKVKVKVFQSHHGFQRG